MSMSPSSPEPLPGTANDFASREKAFAEASLDSANGLDTETDPTGRIPLVKRLGATTRFVAGLAEGMAAHPLAIRTKASPVLFEFADELKESSKPNKALATSIGGLAAQGIDRARVSLILIPTVAIDVLEQTNSSLLAGMAAGAIYTVWCGSVGGAAKVGLDQFPKTVESFKETCPSIVDFAADALPGLSSADEERRDSQEKPSPIRRLGRWAWLNAKRTGVGMGTGSTGFVATAMAKGYPSDEINKLNYKVSAASGVGTFAFVAAVAQSIKELGERGHPELAQDITNVAGNYRFWLVVAAGTMALNYVSNRIKKAGQAQEIPGSTEPIQPEQINESTR